jgi:hypothetical protein
MGSCESARRERGLASEHEQGSNSASMIAFILSGYGNVGRRLRLIFILVLINVPVGSCTWPDSSEKNVEKLCTELSTIAQKLGYNINRFDDIYRQMTVIVRMSTNYNDTIQIVFILEKVNLLRVIASYEQKSLELTCHVQKDYRGDFCQERVESLQRVIGLAALHVETLQDIAQKIANDAARYQIDELAKTIRSTVDLYQQSIAIFRSLRLSK